MFNIFKKTRTEYHAFHTGTAGMEQHRNFLKMVDEKGCKIVNAFVTYHSYSHSHKPDCLHYVIQYKK